MTWLHLLVWQQYDPLAFLQALRNYPHKIWWPAWQLRAAVLGVAIAGLLLIAYLTGIDWKSMIGVVLIVPLAAQIFCSFPITTLGQAQFWFLYAYSPLLIGIAFLCGLGVHFGFWRWWGFQLGVPFYLGKLITDAGVVWVFLQQEAFHHDHERQRSGGIPGRLPALTWQRRARYVRLLATGILSFVIVYLYPMLPVQEMGGSSLSHTAMRAIHIVLSIAAGAAGGLGLDATLLAIAFKIPPVCFTSQRQWRTTYIGRMALFLPVRRMGAIFASEVPTMAQSAAILTLLKQSGLSPTVRRACRQITVTHQHQLLLTLSLQDGGADAIHYLLPTLNSSLKPIAECYAALAMEAAKPFDLQQWIHTLDSQFSTTEEWPDWESSPWAALQHARNALLTFKNDAEVTLALRSLQEFRDTLYQSNGFPDDAALDSAWPAALWIHLKQHQERLCIG